MNWEQYKDTFTSLGLHASYDDLRTDDTASDNLKKQHGSFAFVNDIYHVLMGIYINPHNFRVVTDFHGLSSWSEGVRLKDHINNHQSLGSFGTYKETYTEYSQDVNGWGATFAKWYRTIFAKPNRN